MFGFDFRVSFERKLWIKFRFFVIFILNFNPCHHRFHVHQSASTKEFVDFSLVRGGVCEALRIISSDFSVKVHWGIYSSYRRIRPLFGLYAHMPLSRYAGQWRVPTLSR